MKLFSKRINLILKLILFKRNLTSKAHHFTVFVVIKIGLQFNLIPKENIYFKT